jgi:large subunit ribosomal protein L18
MGDQAGRAAQGAHQTHYQSGCGRAAAAFRSPQHIYAQVIDDCKGVTLASALSLGKDMRASLKTGADISAAKLVGNLVAERADAAGVKDVTFDRGSCLYHGRVKALADARAKVG